MLGFTGYWTCLDHWLILSPQNWNWKDIKHIHDIITNITIRFLTLIFVISEKAIYSFNERNHIQSKGTRRLKFLRYSFRLRWGDWDLWGFSMRQNINLFLASSKLLNSIPFRRVDYWVTTGFVYRLSWRFLSREDDRDGQTSEIISFEANWQRSPPAQEV